MSVQMAEGLLAVIWLDRCRQAQRLTEGQGRGYREEVVRVLLASLITEQRWGFGGGVLDQTAGIFNFDPAGWVGQRHAHWVEEILFNRIVEDIQDGSWRHIEDYMLYMEFFGRFPPDSIHRLPEGSPMR